MHSVDWCPTQPSPRPVSPIVTPHGCLAEWHAEPHLTAGTSHSKQPLWLAVRTRQRLVVYAMWCGVGQAQATHHAVHVYAPARGVLPPQGTPTCACGPKSSSPLLPLDWCSSHRRVSRISTWRMLWRHTPLLAAPVAPASAGAGAGERGAPPKLGLPRFRPRPGPAAPLLRALASPLYPSWTRAP